MLAVLLALGGLGPVKPVVPVAPLHYRIDAKSHQKVDLTAAGQGLQVSDLTAHVFLAVTMMDTVGGKLAHMIIDSMQFEATGSMAQAYTQATADSAKGAVMHAYVVNGKVKDKAKLTPDNAATQLASQTLSLLFAGTRAGVKMGDSWTDTTGATNKAANGTTTTSVITGWKVTGAEGDAVTVEGTGTGKSSVEGPPGGQQIAGTSTSKSSITSPAGGPSRHATLQSNQVLSVTIAALPEPIPVTATSTLTLTLIN